MVALAAADWTVTIDQKRIMPKQKRWRVKLVIGDGAKTYPTGGIPLPAYNTLGFVRYIDHVILMEDDSALGRGMKWDKANAKLKLFAQGVTTGATAAGALANGAFAVNSAAAETVVRFSNTAISTSYDFGPLAELPSTIAPAQFTVWAEVVGW